MVTNSGVAFASAAVAAAIVLWPIVDRGSPTLTCRSWPGTSQIERVPDSPNLTVGA
ncbi:hypothetical protein GCM10023152_33070 [Agromyces bauzanensis]|uniref:Uncharacterized protein n=1 Tax=Agromyces bauzanensis TaxID=1308924 RepID=A0A917UXU6_9MICO|nr:hypothetical protein GCM10011372_34860 [Agromyces bauzanensis]